MKSTQFIFRKQLLRCNLTWHIVIEHPNVLYEYYTCFDKHWFDKSKYKFTILIFAFFLFYARMFLITCCPSLQPCRIVIDVHQFYNVHHFSFIFHFGALYKPSEWILFLFYKTIQQSKLNTGQNRHRCDNCFLMLGNQ